MKDHRVYSVKILGTIIKSERKRRKINQTELGKKAQLAQPTISDIENGINNVKLGSILKVLEVLELDLFIASKKENEDVW